MEHTSPRDDSGEHAIATPAARAVEPAGSDLLHGAAEIAEFLFGDRAKSRQVYYLAETRQLPIFRLSGKLAARRSSLLRALEELEQAEGA